MTLPTDMNGICDFCGHDRNDARDMSDVSCDCECHGFYNSDEPSVDITIISISESDKDN